MAPGGLIGGITSPDPLTLLPYRAGFTWDQKLPSKKTPMLNYMNLQIL